MDRDALTPAQRRLLEELLAIDAPRPAADPSLGTALREGLEERIAPAVDLVPEGERLVLHKGALNALSCEGRYLDLVDRPFSWEVPIVRGKLAHRAIELDWRSGRVHPPEALVGYAWDELSSDRGLGEFLAGLDPITTAELRTDAEQLLTDVRDVWPPIPSTWSPRLEGAVGATLAEGRVQLRGKTDLTIGSVRADRCQMIVVDLKTGWRRPQTDRQDLRTYGLLLTLKHGVAPFRLATYYVTEGAWDVEDVTEDVLESALRRVSDAVVRAARLTFRRPADDGLHLVAGAHCRWCGRAPSCPAATLEDELSPTP